MSRPWILVSALLLVGLTAAVVAVASRSGGDSAEPPGVTTIPQPTQGQLEASGLAKLPLAPESERVDVAAPVFSDPTTVTNPLFPISELHSAILSGTVESKPFHTETTLLPDTRIIEWAPGHVVETLVSQYVAYLDGRIEEVALDYYAQADDGSVWYFGEEVFNYSHDGVVADTEGTWLAGKDGPPAMIMPTDPQVGDVHRPENIPGNVFEEVAVKAIDATVNGPTGPVAGAIVGEELHQDGTFSDKTFAPGYGEFYSAHEGDVEAMALAVPTDALGGPAPAELEALSAGADDAFAATRARNWKGAATGVESLAAAWATLQSGPVPPRLATEMNRALATLTRAVNDRDRTAAGTAATDVAQSALDLELRYRPPAVIDRARFELWARQVLVDASAGDLPKVVGDVAVLEWVRDRFAQDIDDVGLTRIDQHLQELRNAVNDENLRALAAEAARLRVTLARP